MWTFSLMLTRLEYLYTISLPVLIVVSARCKHFLFWAHVLHADIFMCELKNYVSVLYRRFPWKTFMLVKVWP